MKTSGKQNPSEYRYSSIFVDKGAVVRDGKRIERLGVI
jgi:hypothetical protein